jgi:threonine synthase
MEIITGKTTIEKLNYKDQELFFKRDDQNPSGSFKDRLINHIWQKLQGLEQTEIVLSSSGNLAISLLYFQSHSDKKLDKKIKIFVKEDMPEEKFDRLTSLADRAGSQLIVTKRPKSDCFRYSKQDNVFWLRNSEGKDYPRAYHSLANEIIQYEKAENIKFDAIFIATSSGTAALGLMQKLLDENREIPVFIVQTSHVNTIAKEFDQIKETEQTSIANAISDRIAKRKKPVVELIAKLKGGGIIVDNSQIAEARTILRSLLDNEFSGNAALSLAGFFKSKEKGYNFKRPLLIISGN